MVKTKNKKSETELLRQMIPMEKRIDGLTDDEMESYHKLSVAYAKQNCYMPGTVIVKNGDSM